MGAESLARAAARVEDLRRAASRLPAGSSRREAAERLARVFSALIEEDLQSGRESGAVRAVQRVFP